MRRMLPLMLIALLAVPAAAGAKVKVAVGIGDQSAKMFSNPLYKDLKMKKTRYFIHWNAASNPTELKKAADFVTAAKASRVKVLMHISTNNLTPGKGTLPSVSQYKKSVGDLIKMFKPSGVKEWGVWNEANHKTQPTSKNPKRAAQFYKTMKGMCKGCKIVALDVLDQAGVEKYIARWFKAAGSSGKTAKVIGIHNYSEVNRRLKEKGRSRASYRKYPGTKKIINAVKKKNKVAKFWYTETGGLVNFGSGFPCDEKRPASRNKFMFSMAKRYDKLFERLYTYNWHGTSPDCQGFDAGLVNADGSARPGYAPFKSALKNFGR